MALHTGFRCTSGGTAEPCDCYAWCVEPYLLPTCSVAQGSRHQSLPAVALCVIHKDQNEDVEEWIDYHVGLGVSKIFFFDHNSTTPIRDTLSQYDEIVEYEEVSTAEAAPLNPQMFVYQKCLAHKEVPWIAFIDVDEFIVLKTKEYDSLPELLTEFRNVGALAMNWVGARPPAPLPEVLVH